MRKTRVTLIHNPKAGDERQPSAGQLQALLKEAGYKVRYQSTAQGRWQKVLERPADIVAVAGGDGTVHKVARRLIGTDVPIGVLPMGTANNISKTLGIADHTVIQLIPAWKNARRITFDAGLASGPWGKRYFIEGFGAGLVTNSMLKAGSSKTLAQLPQTDVKVAYAQQLFREHVADIKALKIDATLDGADISGSYLLIEVMNTQYIGPNLFLAPETVHNDGQFEVVVVAEKHRKKLHNHIRHWQEGKLLPPEFKTYRGSRLQMRWSGFKLHLDDKVWPGKPKAAKRKVPEIELQVVPHAVRFLVPVEVDEMNRALRRNTEKAKLASERAVA